MTTQALLSAIADRLEAAGIPYMVVGSVAGSFLRKDRPFSVTEFGCRFLVPLLGRPTPIATAEDVVIAKLEWAKAGASERQLRDVAGILAASGETLDMDYVERWIAELGLAEQWQRAQQLEG